MPEPTWREMTYAELINAPEAHNTERHPLIGIVHSRSCWCAQTSAPSSSADGATTSNEEQ